MTDKAPENGHYHRSTFWGLLMCKLSSSKFDC